MLFIDTPPYLSTTLPQLFDLSDFIIVPTKAGIADLMAIRSTIAMITARSANEKAFIVFNMIKPQTTLTDEISKMLADFPVAVAKTQISDLVAFTRSFITSGVETKKRIHQMDQLTEEILNLL